MLPSDFSIVFQPPMVVGQRPRATSPLPTRAYSVSVGRSLTEVVPGEVLAEISRAAWLRCWLDLNRVLQPCRP
jgi:hypothetical protein